MLPEAEHKRLLYVTAQYYGDTFVYTFPDGKLVSGMSNTGDTGGPCTNAAGDVFITTQYCDLRVSSRTSDAHRDAQRPAGRGLRLFSRPNDRRSRCNRARRRGSDLSPRDAPSLEAAQARRRTAEK
jgi:hypothetical protein